jgi:hypothetical protein
MFSPVCVSPKLERESVPNATAFSDCTDSPLAIHILRHKSRETLGTELTLRLQQIACANRKNNAASSCFYLSFMKIVELFFLQRTMRNTSQTW